MTMPYATVVPVIDPSVRALCKRPYPLHPRGCPNFGKDRCPPKVRLYGDVYDLARPCYAIWSAFDLGAHVERMRVAHPRWSDRQLRNCLYWQGTARKLLRKEISGFCWKKPGYDVTECPEAMGVNVTETMRRAGIVLEWPPIQMVVHVALAATFKGSVGEEDYCEDED